MQEYIRNSRDVQLFTCRWLPLSPPKALVFLCHGRFSFLFQGFLTFFNSFLPPPQLFLVGCLFDYLSNCIDCFAGYGMECSGFMRGNQCFLTLFCLRFFLFSVGKTQCCSSVIFPSCCFQLSPLHFIGCQNMVFVLVRKYVTAK